MKSPWLQFESKLAEWMKEYSSKTIAFTNGNQAIPGYPSNGFRADGLLTDGKTLIALEVEAKQTHPDTNVGKYWLLSEYKKYRNIILYHVYTPEYNSYPWRLKLGEFYASKMEADFNFEYHLMDMRCAENIDEAFDRVCLVLERRVYTEFLEENA